MSDLVRCYNREEITLWASMDSEVMKECQRAVRDPQSSHLVWWCYVRAAACLDSFPTLSPPCLRCASVIERVHAVQFHTEARHPAPAALLQWPAALCAPGGELTAVLPPTNHQQVWLRACVCLHVESVAMSMFCSCWNVMLCMTCMYTYMKRHIWYICQ